MSDYFQIFSVFHFLILVKCDCDISQNLCCVWKTLLIQVVHPLKCSKARGSVARAPHITTRGVWSGALAIHAMGCWGSGVWCDGAPVPPAGRRRAWRWRWPACRRGSRSAGPGRSACSLWAKYLYLFWLQVSLGVKENIMSTRSLICKRKRIILIIIYYGFIPSLQSQRPVFDIPS